MLGKLKKVNVSASQKRYFAIAVVGFLVLLVMIMATFGGGSDVERRSESGENRSSLSGVRQGARSTEAVSPDETSAVDSSSPIAQNARETEERQRAAAMRDNRAYLGNMFGAGAESPGDDPISYGGNSGNPGGESDTSFDQASDTDEAPPEPPATPASRGAEGQQNRQAQYLTLESGNGNNGGQGVSLSEVIGNNDRQVPVAGSLTVFSERSAQSGNGQAGSNRNTAEPGQNNVREVDSGPYINMYEASSPMQNRRNEGRGFGRESVARVTPGSMYYATIALGINSDDRGPALATLREGPLNGAKLIGDYTLNELSKAVNVEFSTLSYRGQQYDIEATAYDLETERPVLVDDVNNHYLQRYGGLMLSAFVASYADSLENRTTVIGDSGSVTTIDEGLDNSRDRLLSALGGPAGVLAEELRSNVNRPVTVYVNRNSGTGILFLSPLDINL